jgi:hypothetical protein
MMDMYRVQFDYPRPTKAIPNPPTRICTACAVGHHEQPILGDESSDCPCHGTPLEVAGYEVAA